MAKQSDVMEARFEADSKLSIQALHSNLISNSTSLNALKAFRHTTNQYDRAKFEEFATPLLADHPSLLVYAWLPKIPHSDRHKFENLLSEMYKDDLTILDADGKGNFTPAKVTETYFPVIYGIPNNVAKSRIGVDVASLPVGGPAVQHALQSKELSASGPINYTAEFGQNANIILFNAVFDHSDSENTVDADDANKVLLGLVMGLFRVGDLIENQFNGEKFLTFQIEDVTDANNPQTIYGYPSRSHESAFYETLSFAGREWKVTSSTTHAGYEGRWVPKAMLLTGLLLTIMSTFGLFSLTRRKIIVEGIVDDRTRDLNESVEQLFELIRRQKVVELTLETRTDELGQAVENLASSNEELARFAFVCSHDIQEPLRTIRTFSEMLDEHLAEKNESDLEIQQYLGFINNSATRAQELIRDILEYSRIDKDTIKPESIDLNALIDSIVDNIGPDLAKVGGRLIRDTLPAVIGNKTQIYQVFQNLINNGLKYQEEGNAPEVHITCRDATSHWQLSVRDNGIGIAKHHLHKIFEVFERLNSQTAYTGTGIGLSICKKVVERHGGEIWAESSPKGGSVFSFTVLKSN